MTAGSSRRSLPRWAPHVMIYALSGAFLAWALHGYQFDELVPAVRSLGWGWVAFAVACNLSTYLVQAWRWNTLLAPVARLGFWRTTHAIFVGMFANEIAPLRVGEVIRCYLLAHYNDLNLSVAFASWGVERLVDGLWLLATFIVTAAFVKGIPRQMSIAVVIVGILLMIGVAVLTWTVMHKQHAHTAIRESRWGAALRHVVEGLHLMGNRRTMLRTMWISGIYLAPQFLMVWALMRAYGLDYSFWVACGVTTMVRVATVIPNAPGNIGLVNAAFVMALTIFELEPNEARTFSIILYVAQTLPLLIAGAVATALTGFNIGELHARARRGLDAQKPSRLV